ncbi:unnamed protein product [Durusdinium trenchii]|uniref:RanBP2-type domain-containing protein n=1 Tax=Durusdinium trenchii TaxID=1381693 RepID=A0ABP0N3C8_9DINO
MSRGLRQSDGVDTVMNPCLHIVESVDLEKMGEETPTDYYYEQLRKDLGERYPKADPFLLDHLVSLEGFLDKSIIFGFSFGVSKAEICVEHGKLLGHLIGRHGMLPDPERCQAVGRIVWSWLEAHPPSRIDFWELFAGQAGLTLAARQRRLSVAPPLDRLYPAFGKAWDLSSPVDQELFWCLYMVLQPAALHAGLPCEHYSVMGQRKPDSNDRSVRELVMRVLAEQEKGGRKGTVESPTGSQLWSEDDWVRSFGQLASPKPPWQYASTDGCQYGMESKGLTDGSFGQPVKKGQIWLSNFCLSEFSLRSPARSICQRVPPLEAVSSRNAVYTAVSERQGVVTSDELSAAEREQLDKEVAALSKQMDELWKTRAHGEGDFGPQPPYPSVLCPVFQRLRVFVVRFTLFVSPCSCFAAAVSVAQSYRVGRGTRAVAADGSPASRMGRGRGKGQKHWKRNYWEDAGEMGRAMTKAYRHGGYDHRGCLDPEGWIRLDASAELFQVPVAHMQKAIELDGKGAKKRFEVTSQSLAERGLGGDSPLWHGTVLERCDGIVRFGMLPGGGDASNRLTVYWVAGSKPSPGEGRTGFRADSTAVVETSVRNLWAHGVKMYHGADGEYGASAVLLSLAAPPESLTRILAIGEESQAYDQVLAEITDSGFELVPAKDAPEARDVLSGVIELPDGDTEATTTDDDEPADPKGAASSSWRGVKEEAPAEAAGSRPLSRSAAELRTVAEPVQPVRAEPLTEPPEGSEVKVGEVASREAAPPEGHKREVAGRKAAPPVVSRPRARVPRGYEGEPPNFWWTHIPRPLWRTEEGICLLCKSRAGKIGTSWITDEHLGSIQHVNKMFELAERYDREQAAAPASSSLPSRDAGPLPTPAKVEEAKEAEPTAAASLPSVVPSSGEKGPVLDPPKAEEPEATAVAGPASCEAEGSAPTSAETEGPEGEGEEPEAGGVPLSSDASLGAELKDRTLETEPGAAPSAAGEREGKEQTLEPTKDDGEEFVEVEEGEASPDLEAKAARRKRSKKEGHSEKGHSGRRRHRRPSKRLKILRDANLKEKRYRSHSEEEATGGDHEQRGDSGRSRSGRSRSRSRGVSSRSPPRRPRSPDLPTRRPKSPDGTPPEPSSRERFSLRPVRFEWGSWVCHVCGAVNAPGDEYCFVCEDSFWNSTEWANELYREIRRRERAAKKAEFSTLLAKALAAGRWECDRCGGENMLSRVKCYQCSTLRSRHRGDDESSDSERERLVERTLRQMPEVKRRKRAGRKHKKKVCRCGRVHHRSPRGHRAPRTVKGLSLVKALEIGMRKRLVSKPWKKHFAPRKVLNKLQHALNGNGPSVDLAVKVLVGASLIPLAWRTEQEVEEVLDSISSLSSRVLFEIEETTAQTIQITGLICKSAVLGLGIMGLWFLGRTVANRLFEEGSVVKNKGAAALKSMGVSGRSTEALCFTGVVSKAQRLFSADESKETTAGCFKGLTHGRVNEDLQHAVREKDAVAAVRAPRPKGGASSAEITVEYLKDRASQEAVIDLLERHPDSAVFLAAYSLDQPDLTKAFAKHKGKIELLADAGQTHRTKLQLQSLLEIRSGGHSVRVARGQSLAKTYKEDGRAVRVGANLKGIQHAKSCLVMTAVHAYLVLGSCNWTTSSKSNRESGLLLTMPKEHQSVRDFLSHFSESWDAGASLEEVQFQQNKTQGGQGRARASTDGP